VVRGADFIWAVVTIFDTAAAYDVPCAGDSNIWVFSVSFVIVAPIIACCVSSISMWMRRSILSCFSLPPTLSLFLPLFLSCFSLPPSLPLIRRTRHLFSPHTHTHTHTSLTLLLSTKQNIKPCRQHSR